MKDDCPICGGAGKVTLAMRPRPIVLISDGPNNNQPMLASGKTYPCPECSDKVQVDRILMLSATRLSRFMSKEILEHEMVIAARALADLLIRERLILYESIDVPKMFEREIVATVGVIAPDHVRKMRERIADAQGELANATVAIAVDLFDRHSRDFGGRMNASEAISILKGALDIAKQKQTMKEIK